jgi:hypothetical protein
MVNFIIRRLIASAIVIVLLSVATFAVLRVLPGAQVTCEPGVLCNREYIEAKRKELGYDKPYFPVSFEGGASPQDAWLLVLPALGVAALAGVRWKQRVTS